MMVGVMGVIVISFEEEPKYIEYVDVQPKKEEKTRSPKKRIDAN